jgi:hypothetical protein
VKVLALGFDEALALLAVTGATRRSAQRLAKEEKAATGLAKEERAATAQPQGAPIVRDASGNAYVIDKGVRRRVVPLESTPGQYAPAPPKPTKAEKKRQRRERRNR